MSNKKEYKNGRKFAFIIKYYDISVVFHAVMNIADANAIKNGFFNYKTGVK